MSAPKIDPAFAGQPVPREEYDRMCDQRDEQRARRLAALAKAGGLHDLLVDVAAWLARHPRDAWALEEARSILRCAGYICDTPETPDETVNFTAEVK